MCHTSNWYYICGCLHTLTAEFEMCDLRLESKCDTHIIEEKYYQIQCIDCQIKTLEADPAALPQDYPENGLLDMFEQEQSEKAIKSATNKSENNARNETENEAGNKADQQTGNETDQQTGDEIGQQAVNETIDNMSKETGNDKDNVGNSDGSNEAGNEASS